MHFIKGLANPLIQQGLPDTHAHTLDTYKLPSLRNTTFGDDRTSSQPTFRKNPPSPSFENVCDHIPHWVTENTLRKITKQEFPKHYIT